MRFTKLSVLIGSMAILLLASTAFAQGCCGAGAANGPAVWSDLTPEQQKQATALRTEFLKKQEALRSDMAKKRIEMMELASKEKPDEAAIEKKRQEIWGLQDDMIKESRTMGVKFRALLTPEQKQKLASMGPRFQGTGPGACCGLGSNAGCGGCLGKGGPNL